MVAWTAVESGKPRSPHVCFHAKLPFFMHSSAYSRIQAPGLIEVDADVGWKSNGERAWLIP